MQAGRFLSDSLRPLRCKIKILSMEPNFYNVTLTNTALFQQILPVSTNKCGAQSQSLEWTSSQKNSLFDNYRNSYFEARKEFLITTYICNLKSLGSVYVPGAGVERTEVLGLPKYRKIPVSLSKYFPPKTTFPSSMRKQDIDFFLFHSNLRLPMLLNWILLQII